MNTATKVALDKQKHPERYCAEPRCLWKTVELVYDQCAKENFSQVYVPRPDCPGGRCPRHQRKESQ